MDKKQNFGGIGKSLHEWQSEDRPNRSVICIMTDCNEDADCTATTIIGSGRNIITGLVSSMSEDEELMLILEAAIKMYKKISIAE